MDFGKARLNELMEQFGSDNQLLEELMKEFRTDNIILRTGRMATCLPVWFSLLRELILTQRWEHIPDILSYIFANEQQSLVNHDDLNNAIINVTMECFLQSGTKDTLRFANVIKKLCKVDSVDSHVVVMTFFLFLIRSGRSDEAKMFQDMKKIHHSQVDVRKDLRLVMRAYKGMISYMEWSKLRTSIKEMENDEASMSTGSADEILMHKTHLDDLAKETEEKLKVIVGSREVFDVFVSKYLEILEYLGKINEADALQRNYIKMHPDNFFAHTQFYHFQKRHEYNRKDRIGTLKEVTQLAPFDELALELHELLKEEREECDEEEEQNYTDLSVKSCTLLFDLLDYPQWNTHPDVWQRLAVELCNVCKSCKGCNEVKELWLDRRQWWPGYCFGKVDSNDASVYWKVICAALLFGKDHHIVKRLIDAYNETYGELRSLRALIQKNHRQCCTHIKIT